MRQEQKRAATRIEDERVDIDRKHSDQPAATVADAQRPRMAPRDQISRSSVGVHDGADLLVDAMAVAFEFAVEE